MVHRFCHSSYCDLDSDAGQNEKAEPEAIHIPGTDRPSASSVVAGDRQRCLCRGAPGAPPALSGLPPLPSAAQPWLAQGPDADSQCARGNPMKADAPGPTPSLNILGQGPEQLCFHRALCMPLPLLPSTFYFGKF